jgi:hypothetical protein
MDMYFAIVKRNNFIDYIIFEWATAVVRLKIMRLSLSTEKMTGCISATKKGCRSGETGIRMKQQC